MKKRLVSMILSAVLFATSVPVAAFAEDANTQNPVVHWRKERRHVEVLLYGSNGNYVI